MRLINLKLTNGKKINLEIENEKLVDVSKSQSIETIDFKNEFYVSPGWIDAHTHAFSQYDFIGDEADKIGINMGVTTLIDAGTVGALDIDKLIQESQQCKTDIFSLLNISKIGISRQDELSDMNNIDFELFDKAINNYKKIIIGIKVRMSGSVVKNNGLKPLLAAKKMQIKTNLPLMIHIGNPEPNLDDILKIVGENDIITHCFHGKKSSILSNSTKTEQLLRKALKRGLKLDIGHGSDSFDINICKEALAKNIKSTTISSDIYRTNRVNGPVYSLALTMSKMLAAGYSHEEIIKQVTVNPAKIFNLTDRGQLKGGLLADLTIYKLENKVFIAKDSNNNNIYLKKVFIPYYIVKNGKLERINDG